MSLVVGSVTFSAAADHFCGSAGAYFRGGGGLECEEHRSEENYVPARDGADVIWHGFMQRLLEGIEVIYVDSSHDNVVQAYDSDQASLVGQLVDVTYYGVSLPGCKVESFKMTRAPKPTLQNGTVKLHCSLRIRQLQKDAA